MNKQLKDHPYFKQASLMLEALPSVAAEECFALKGGTAINFFLRDMPRLSVDIDRDDEATEIIAKVVSLMDVKIAIADTSELIPLEQWYRSLFKSAEIPGSDSLIVEASHVARDLLSKP